MGWTELPDSLKEFSDGKNTFKYVCFEGSVVGKGQWSDTYVSGQGDKYGSVVTSDVVQRLEFFLRDEEKREEEGFKFSDAKFAVRDGQYMAIAWAFLNGQKSGEYRLVRNFTTNEWKAFPFEFQGLKGFGGGLLGVILVLAGILGGLISLVFDDQLAKGLSPAVAPIVGVQVEGYSTDIRGQVVVPKDSWAVPFLAFSNTYTYSGDHRIYKINKLLSPGGAMTLGLAFSVFVFFWGGIKLGKNKTRFDALKAALADHEQKIGQFLAKPDEMQETARLMDKVSRSNKKEATAEA